MSSPSVAKRVWDVMGWFVGGYTIYKQLQTVKEAKDEIYTSLSPDMQKKWESVFGKPEAPAVVAPAMPAVVIKEQVAVSKPVSQLEQLKSGS